MNMALEIKINQSKSIIRRYYALIKFEVTVPAECGVLTTESFENWT
jgi:hypothetical protein